MGIDDIEKVCRTFCSTAFRALLSTTTSTDETEQTTNVQEPQKADQSGNIAATTEPPRVLHLVNPKHEETQTQAITRNLEQGIDFNIKSQIDACASRQLKTNLQ